MRLQYIPLKDESDKTCMTALLAISRL